MSPGYQHSRSAQDPILMPDFLRTCEEAARASGAVLLDWAGRFKVREKGPSELVTEAHFASQTALRDTLLTALPDHGILGEEGGEDLRPNSAYRWIVDTQDGTTNYVYQLLHYFLSVALYCYGQLLA